MLSRWRRFWDNIQMASSPRSPRKIAALLTITLVLGAFGPQIQAAPIQGDIDFGGVVTFDSTSLQNATRVTAWNSSFVLQSSGDFDTFTNPGDPATMSAPWIFTPSTARPSLWAVGGFTFDLSSSVVVSQSAEFLDISGAGTLSGNGFDPTPGTWSFTSSNANGQPSATFGFQAQATAVPEASTLALLGFGTLAVLGGRLARRKAA